MARAAAAQRAIERRFNAFVLKLGTWMQRQPADTLEGLELHQIVDRFVRLTGHQPPCDMPTLKRVCGEAIEQYRATTTP